MLSIDTLVERAFEKLNDYPKDIDDFANEFYLDGDPTKTYTAIIERLNKEKDPKHLLKGYLDFLRSVLDEFTNDYYGQQYDMRSLEIFPGDDYYEDYLETFNSYEEFLKPNRKLYKSLRSYYRQEFHETVPPLKHSKL